MLFLPADYKVPSGGGGGYMKLQQGDNKFRILSSLVMGYEAWTTNKKCIRKKDKLSKTWADYSSLLQKRDGVQVEPKHFWAFFVWNRTDKAIQLLTITQTTIMKALESLALDEDWGDPSKYDIKINRSGEGMETAYTINPSPQRDLDDDVAELFLAYDKKLDDIFDLEKGETATAEDLPF